MKITSGALRDLALLVLAVLTVAGAGFAVLRTPGGVASIDRAVAPIPSPSPSPSPSADRVEALFVGADLLLGEPSLADLAAERLGWTATVDAVPGTGYVGGDPAQTYVQRVAATVGRLGPDVVVVLSSAADAEETDGRLLGGNVQALVGVVRRTAPAAQIVLVGPVLPDPGAAALQRQVLTQVAARFGAFYLDPTGRGYVAGRADLRNADGSLTPEGARVVAGRMVADLRIVLPGPLLPVARSTP